MRVYRLLFDFVLCFSVLSILQQQTILKYSNTHYSLLDTWYSTLNERVTRMSEYTG